MKSGAYDALNNWYIRRSRDRFWSTAEPVHKASKMHIMTLFQYHTCKLVAPSFQWFRRKSLRPYKRVIGSRGGLAFAARIRSDSDLVETIV